MAEADSEKRSQDSGYEENENIEDAGSRSLKSYTSFDNSSLLSMELSDVSIYLKSFVKRSLISQLLLSMVGSINIREDHEGPCRSFLATKARRTWYDHISTNLLLYFPSWDRESPPLIFAQLVRQPNVSDDSLSLRERPQSHSKLL